MPRPTNVDSSDAGVIIFLRVGPVERCGKRGAYAWHQGYSEITPEGRETQPWVTYREALATAKARGQKAKFLHHLDSEGAR